MTASATLGACSHLFETAIRALSSIGQSELKPVIRRFCHSIAGRSRNKFSGRDVSPTAPSRLIARSRVGDQGCERCILSPQSLYNLFVLRLPLPIVSPGGRSGDHAAALHALLSRGVLSPIVDIGFSAVFRLEHSDNLSIAHQPQAAALFCSHPRRQAPALPRTHACRHPRDAKPGVWP